VYLFICKEIAFNIDVKENDEVGNFIQAEVRNERINGNTVNLLAKAKHTYTHTHTQQHITEHKNWV